MTFLSLASLGRNHIWRYAATLVATLLTFLAAHAPMIAVVQSHAADFGADEIDRIMVEQGLPGLGVDANLALALNLFPFALGLAALLLCVRYIHRRPVLSVLTSRARFDWARLGVAGAVWFVVAGGIALWAIPGEAMRLQFALSTFLPLLAVALVLVPFQVAAEEVLFRGWMLQGLGRIFARPVLPLLIVTLVFAAVHLGNPEFANGLLRVAPVYLLLSLFFGLLAVVDDGLEMPIGAHLGNNLFSALVLSTSDGALRTDSVFQTEVTTVIDHLWTLAPAIPLALVALHLIYRFDWSRLWRAHARAAA